MEKYFDIAKHGGRWAVVDYTSRTFSHIGEGKKNCKKIADRLNKAEA